MADKFKPFGPYNRPSFSQPPWTDPSLKQFDALLEENRDKYLELGHLFQKMIAVFYEQLLFQNLLPAFDSIPMKRVFMLCAYSPRKEDSFTGTSSFTEELEHVVEWSGCQLVWEYPELTGSRLRRGVLQTPYRLTRREFENLYGQIPEELAKRLKDASEKNVTIVNNFYIGHESAAKERPKDWTWTERVKDLAEALKNLLLVGAGVCFIFDGTLVKSTDSDSQHREVSVLKVPRDKELELLPEVLEATSPQDFRRAVEPLNSESLSPKKPKPGRKFRSEAVPRER
jgi:hypothetical protein